MMMRRVVLRREGTECGVWLGLRTRRPQLEFDGENKGHDDSAI
jgi:hypothetical protein